MCLSFAIGKLHFCSRMECLFSINCLCVDIHIIISLCNQSSTISRQKSTWPRHTICNSFCFLQGHTCKLIVRSPLNLLVHTNTLFFFFIILHLSACFLATTEAIDLHFTELKREASPLSIFITFVSFRNM